MNETFSTEIEIAEHFEHCEQANIDQDDFMAWLAKYDAEVKAEAWSTGWRQRGDMMLGLLGRYKEEIMDSANIEAENGGDPAWDIERAEVVARCIALIKGENE